MNMTELEMMATKYPCEELRKPTGESADRWITCPAVFAFDKVTAPEDGKFSCALIFPPAANLLPLKEAATRTAAAKFPNVAQLLAANKFRTPFKLQADMAGKYEGFNSSGEFINASSKFAPDFYAADGRTKLTVSPDILWAGCIVRAGLTCYTYDKDGNGKAVTPGVSFGLAFLQFIAAGEKLSGGINPADYLKPIEGLATPSMPAAATANGAAAPKPITGALF